MIVTQRMVVYLNVWPGAMARNLASYGVFAATERLLMEAVKAGGDRQHLHEVIRVHSLAAWATVQRGEANPLADSLAADPNLTARLSPARIRSLLDAGNYVGEAPARARHLADVARALLGQGETGASMKP